MMRVQQGFTTLELLVSVAVLGVLLAILAPLSDSNLRLKQAAQRVEQLSVNRTWEKSILTWMRQTGRSALPTSYSGGGLQNVILNPLTADAEELQLIALATAQGLSVEQIGRSEPGQEGARVYQTVTGLTIDWPLYDQSGPTVELGYEIAFLYNSQCQVGDSDCYPNPATTVAGFSPLVTNANFTTWALGDEDFSLRKFSTLDLELERLKLTSSRINELRDALRSYFSSQFLAGSPDPNTNYFPAPTGGGAPALGGQAPGTNDGCRDGWYDLSSPNVNVLARMGLLQAEYARTAWGAPIEYCRDFDPALASAEGDAPQNAALRIHERVTQGLAPGAPGVNVVFSI